VKVLFYNHTAQVSGAERVMLMILNRLDRERYELLVACPAGGDLLSAVEEAGVASVPVHELRARFTWRIDRLAVYLRSFVRTVREARAVVAQHEPDLIHANSVRAGLVMSVATTGLGVPVLWHVHDILPRHPLSTAVRLCAFASSRNRVVAVSQAAADAFRGQFLRAARRRVNIEVIHNAVEAERFDLEPFAALRIRRELSLTDSQFVVGAIGQITSRKGQLGLIEAFARVRKELPTAVLLIAGKPLFNRDDEYLRVLKQRIEQLQLSSHVQFLGARGDVPALMRACDLLVVNSLEEPFALVVLEGLASGTPVAATDVGGTPEMITHGKNGWLVPPGDEEGLASAILRLSRNSGLRAQLSDCGKEMVRERFTPSRYMRALGKTYRCISESKFQLRKKGMEVEG